MSDTEIKQDFDASTDNQTGFTIRALIVGMLFVLLIALIVPVNIINVNSSEMATRAFPIAAAVVLMFCIFAGNILLKKVLPIAALRSKEILVVYIMALVASVFPGIGLMMYMGTIAGPAQYGTTGNKYFETLYKGVDRLCIKDRDSDKIRTLSEEELYGLQEAFTAEGSKKGFGREYFLVKAGIELKDGEPIDPKKYDNYKAFLSPENFKRASWDHIVPFDTVETRSIEGSLNELDYMFVGFPPRYNGPGIFEIVMRIWFKPLMWWTVFLLSLCIMVFCAFNILRKQWVEKERLLFPIMRVPIELVEGLDSDGKGEHTPLIKRKLLWFGVMIPLIFITWRYIAHHTGMLPQLPTIRSHSAIGIPGGLQFPQGAAQTPLAIVFPVIGFSYLINLDVSFSLWFFHLLGVFETYAFNIRAVGTGAGGDAYSAGHSYVNHQSIGGVIALVLIGLFIARKHLFGVFRKAFGIAGKEEVDDSKEPLSYRTAVIGLLLSGLFCIAWLVYAGMSIWVAVIFIALSMIMYVGATRVVCEGGIIFVQACMIPQTFMLRSFGAQALGVSNLVLLGLSFMWMADFTSFFMPSVAHSMKLSDTASPKRKKWLFPTAMVVIILVFFITGAQVFKISYNLPKRGSVYNWYFGGGHINTAMRYAVSPIDELNKTEEREKKADECYDTLAAKWPFDNFQYKDEDKNELSRGLVASYNNYVKFETSIKYSVQPKRWFFTLGGFSFMAFLMLMRNRFIWWPLHPIGFPFANSPSTSRIWFSVFIGWLIKFMIIKYGGVKLFKKVKPIFIGIIVGAVIGIGTCYILDMTLFASGVIEKGFSLSE